MGHSLKIKCVNFKGECVLEKRHVQDCIKGACMEVTNMVETSEKGKEFTKQSVKCMEGTSTENKTGMERKMWREQA